MSVDDGIPRLSMAGAVRLGDRGGVVTPRNKVNGGSGGSTHSHGREASGNSGAMTNAREWARFWRCLGRSDHEYLDISEGHRQSQSGTVFVQSGPGTAYLRWTGQLISQLRRRAHVVSDCNPVAAA